VLEEMIVRHCAPTLARMKCGGIFNMVCDGRDLGEQLSMMNSVLNPRGVEVAVLRSSGGCHLVYVYRVHMLEGLLSDDHVFSFLKGLGYDTSDVGSMIRHLSERIVVNGGIVHEIGFFLGYPKEDVIGFIENGGRHYKMIGCWKVYGDEVVAANTFTRIRKCRSVYRRCYDRGVPISDLIVPRLTSLS